MFTTLIRSHQLVDILHQPNLVLLDCRYHAELPDLGVARWEEGHIPGAAYAKLDYHLSGLPTLTTGALTLPDPMRLAVVFGAWGINQDTQVIVYDEDLCHASRAWALLRWMGHECVAVLDGGLQDWRDNKAPLTSDITKNKACRFPIRTPLTWLAGHAPTSSFAPLNSASTVIYAGKHPPPAALCRPWKDNCIEGAHMFKPAAMLRQEWLALLKTSDLQQFVHASSHGVGACVNLLAMEIAGLPGSGLDLLAAR